MDSPIEKRLRDAIREARNKDTRLDDYTESSGADIYVQPGGKLSLERDGQFIAISEGDAAWCAMYAGVRVLSYRVDILLEADANGGTGFIAIECDGHEYHERTKQQAAYDRARDRELMRIGILTLRFTGSEIHHNAFRCAKECWAMVDVLNEREAEQMRLWRIGFDRGYEAARKEHGGNK